MAKKDTKLTADEQEALTGASTTAPPESTDSIDPTKIDPLTGEVLETALTAPRPGDNPLAAPAGFAASMEKAAQLLDPQGSSLVGRLALYQGTTAEQSNYKGLGFETGDWIDVLGRERVGKGEIKIVPVYGFTSWVKWPQGEPVPHYVLRDPSKVPAEDLEWNEGKPPAAAKLINAMVLVEGQTWPFIVIFKRTSFAAGDAIFKLEKRRELANLNRGCYTLYSTEEKGGGGVYQKMKYRPGGDVPESLKPLLALCIADVVKMQEATQRLVENAMRDSEAFHGDDVVE